MSITLYFQANNLCSIILTEVSPRSYFCGSASTTPSYIYEFTVLLDSKLYLNHF